MDKTKKFGVEDVLAALDRAVQLKGADYVYVDEHGTVAGGISEDGTAGAFCRYVHNRDTANPTPGCIVGHVYLDLLGRLPAAEIEQTAPTNANWNYEPFDAQARRALRAAQDAQDEGSTWGAALRIAQAQAATTDV